jgi:hypothetical protein
MRLNRAVPILLVGLMGNRGQTEVTPFSFPLCPKQHGTFEQFGSLPSVPAFP